MVLFRRKTNMFWKPENLPGVYYFLLAFCAANTEVYME